MDVSIIIVNYNTIELTKQCIFSINSHTKGVDFQVIVVDNNSNDNSVKIITDNFPDVILIANKENVGFGRANNLGIKIATGKYTFFLNSDTILLNNVAKIFFDYMEKYNIEFNIGALGCVMLDKDLNLNYWNSFNSFPNLKTHFTIVLSKYFSFFKNKYLKDVQKLEKEGRLSVDFIVGADLFVPSRVIDLIGSFDPDFFLYWEEVDLQYRMSQKKLIRLIITEPKLIHLEGGSSKKKIKNWQRKIETQSLLLYYKKNLGIFDILAIKSFLLALSINKYKRYTVKEQVEYVKTVLKT